MTSQWNTNLPRLTLHTSFRSYRQEVVGARRRTRCGYRSATESYASMAQCSGPTRHDTGGRLRYHQSAAARLRRNWGHWRWETNIEETDWYAPSLGRPVRKENSGYIDQIMCGISNQCLPVRGDWYRFEPSASPKVNTPIHETHPVYCGNSVMPVLR